MQKLLKDCFFALLALTLLGCSVPAQRTATPTKTVSAPGEATATAHPPKATEPAPIVLENLDDNHLPISAIPNLWTKLDGDKITFYPQNKLADYTYDKDGGLWFIGGFGVVHKAPDGKETWYSIKSGLPVNFFSAIAISPKGEIWVGGADNALFRFDGAQWIDEGSKLPPPLDSNAEWLCYSKNILAIDFDESGTAWVMNGGIELYAQAYEQWINFPFPKDLLPYAGGGACPQGLRVKSANDITIKRSGCCANPAIAYHFDGKNWAVTSDYADVESLLAERYALKLQSKAANRIPYIDYRKLRFAQAIGPFLPDDLSAPMLFDTALLATDPNGTIWIKNGADLYNNAKGTFDAYAANNSQNNSAVRNSDLLNFGGQVFYLQDGKSPLGLWQPLNDAGMDDLDPSHPGVDSKNRVWFYHPEKGLGLVDDGQVKMLSANPELRFAEIGGILPLRDGRVLVGSTGLLWLFDGESWQKMVFPGKKELFTALGEDALGIVYAATDTGVYKIDMQHQTFSSSIFVLQDIKPVLVPNGDEPTDGCTFHKRYSTVSNCFGLWQDAAPDFHYSAKLFSVQADGTLYYVNNRLVAKFENGLWKSFLFDSLTIEAATPGKDGSLWIYTGRNGLMQLTPDAFDTYQALPEQ